MPLSLAVRADGPALRLSASCPKRITRFSVGPWDRRPHRVYYGHGYCIVKPDTSRLQSAGGVFVSDIGVPIAMPATGPNACFTAIWDNFPTELRFPLATEGTEVAVLFVGVTNPMQSRIENGCFVVEYADGTEERVSLVNPTNFDDWLNAPVQTESETVCFSDYNHGIVQRIRVAPAKPLKSLLVRAVANEVIIGVLAVSVFWEE